MKELYKICSFALTGWLAMAPISLVAQSDPSPLPGVFSEVLDVRVVNLEVVVTDKDGIPIRGLRAEDFVLTVDGEEIPVEYFTEVRGGVAAKLPEGEGPVGIADIPAVVPGSPVGTSYLVYIDEFFSLAPDRDRVLEALQADLPLLGAQDRMAIVAFNGKDLDMLSTWTNSIPKLSRVVRDARMRPTYGMRRLAEQRQFDFDELLQANLNIRSGVLTTEDFFRTQLTATERFHIDRLTEHVETSIVAAAATLRSFAQPPGRKVMMLYSGGWPFLPAGFLTTNFAWLVVDSRTPRGGELFRPLTDTANLLGYTIYPVDVPGFHDRIAESTVTSSAEFSGRAASAAGPLRQTGFLRQQENHYSLEFLAQETGGEALINVGRLEAFDRVVSDTRSYYWLGFTPDRGWDNRRHEVEIDVRGKGFRVRSRSGFLDSSQQHEVTMAVESALLFGNPPSQELLQVAFGDPKRSGRKKMLVTMSVRVPLDEVTLLPTSKGQAAQLELRIAVRDAEGRRADIPVIPVLLETEQAPSKGAMARYETTLKLRRTSHQAVVAIYDPASGRILSASAEILPGETVK